MTPFADTVSTEEDLVILVVPAYSGYLSVLRTATAGLAARLQFTLDEIEDLRIAVDEACAMLLALAAVDAELTCRFEVTEDALSIEVGVDSDGGHLPGTQSFAWQVLTALAGDVSTSTEPAPGGRQRVTIRLAKRRPDAGPVAGRAASA
ncbi:MAG TPA: anti-sigma regulatory factor [Micromonosporaceae bacterium]